MALRRRFLQSLPSFAFALPLLSRGAQAQGGSTVSTPALPSPSDPNYWKQVRSQFMLAHDKVFFNNGTLGAMPKVVFDKTVEHLRMTAVDLADWDYRGEPWISGYSELKGIRSKAAQLLNASVEEVGLTENVTCAMSYVAAGLELEPGAEIITSNQEHIGGKSPWLNAAKRHGGTVKEVDLPKPIHDSEEVLDLVRKAITPRTKVIALSHVITGSGAILPVKQICAEASSRGIFTVLDGAQSFGHIPVDVKDIGCDAYVGCFHKWLLAPAGNGFLYVRKDRADNVWSTLASGQWDNHRDNGYRFTQRGTGSMSLIMGLDAALDFYIGLGPERIQNRIKYLGNYLRDGLRQIRQVRIYSPEDESMCAGITVYNVDGMTGGQIQDEMWQRARLRPRSVGDRYGVRHCTHIYNSTQEIDRALEIVRALVRGELAD